jgi:hypothetical protein
MKEFYRSKPYKILWIAKFMTFDKFEVARKKAYMDVKETNCFKCDKKFQPDDMTYLGCVEDTGNKMFCEECFKELNDDN